MVSLVFNCPYCTAERAAFVANPNAHCIRRPGENVHNLMMQCGVCGECVIAQFKDSNFQMWLSGHSHSSNLVNIYPNPKPPKYPDHLPPNIARFYQQADDAFTRKNWDSAGTMFRKSLDVGLKILHPAGAGTLEKRINNLPAEIGVTPAMKSWAHQIRWLGNDAAHEEEPFTEEDVKDLQSFTELFLTYAFTLPGLLAQRSPSAIRTPAP